MLQTVTYAVNDKPPPSDVGAKCYTFTFMLISKSKVVTVLF